MRSNGKREVCMKLETTSLIIGILSSFIWLGGMIGGIYLIYCGYGRFPSMPWELRRKKITPRQQMLATGVIILALSAVNLIFSVLLCIGAAKKRLSFLSAYIIFNTLEIITFAVAGTIFSCMVISVPYGIITWVITVIYALLILAVGMTRHNLASGELA